MTLPVVYNTAWSTLRLEIERVQPDVVLAFGLASGARGIRLEHSACNKDGGYPDNRGDTRSGKIAPGGEEFLASTLPLPALKQALSGAGFDVVDSTDAGAYLCNNVFYQLMHYALSERPGSLCAGFIHVPEMPLDGEHGLAQALAIILQTLEERAMQCGVYEFEPLEDDVPGNLSRIESTVRTMAARGVDVHVFPEMALTGFIHDGLDDLLGSNPELKSHVVAERLKFLAKDVQGHVALGMPVERSGQWHNGYAVFFPDETDTYYYAKNHLYGSDNTWSSPGGQNYPVFSLPAGLAGVLICHDVVYQRPSLEYAGQGVEYLIIGANWIGNTPVYKYLRKFPSFKAILVSDRKGSEQGTVFPGNTGVLLSSGEVLRPLELAPGIHGVLFKTM